MSFHDHHYGSPFAGLSSLRYSSPTADWAQSVSTPWLQDPTATYMSVHNDSYEKVVDENDDMVAQQGSASSMVTSRHGRG